MSKSIKNNAICTGCGVCSVVCPKNAISFATDSKGFLRPVVNQNCIDCGLCVKKCHENNIIIGQRVKKAYTAYTMNTQIRDVSSSGGVFSEIAIHIINNGGFVCGAAFDKEFVLRHRIISSIEELEGLRKSKYLESDITQVWKDITKRLKNDQIGLFVGTPCQCAALQTFLGKDVERLLICDFICHGVASPLVFAKYKAHLSGLFGAPKKIEFRHKEKGDGSFFYYEGDMGTYMIQNYKESYPYAYASGMIIADNCTHCQYCKLERYSDITLGDYVSGPTDYSKSTIFANTQKGLGFLSLCSDNLVIKEEPLLEKVIDKSWHLTTPNQPNIKRERVFAELDKSWDYLENKYFHLPSKIELYTQALKNKIKKYIHK